MSVSEFAGDQRFTLVRRLGAGSMGVVYQARDRERETDVALKLLRKVDAAGIYRFKQEFRALADVRHPNLITLHELVSTGDQWFFTMELVEGDDFLTYVRGTADDTRVDTDHDALAVTRTRRRSDDPTVALSSDVDRGRVPVTPALGQRRAGLAAAPATSSEQLARLRRALVGLVEGTCALHRAGQLHRDIKPSNILVDRSGTVRLLDFGVATALGRQAVLEATEELVGTPAYMAPEQADSMPLTVASDWYAVGVVLYEALVGVRPSRGETLAELLACKRNRDPERPAALVAGVPPDLDALCVRLLARDPSARPDGDEILRVLRGEPANQRPSRPQRAPIVGREHELEALRRAFATSREGRTTTVLVHGSSGMGKTELVTRFLEELEASAAAVVLRGRCYERESVPYKALDNLVDALTQHLLHHAGNDWRPPPGVAALARLFPVLHRLEAVTAQAALAPALEPRELRRQAFAALRELLHAIARRVPLVLHIDDLQWGDRDSALLLADVLRPPAASSLLLLAGYRTEDVDTSPFLRELLPLLEDPHRLQVAPLPTDQARALARTLLRETGASPDAADAVAREARGSPFFVAELVRHVASGAGDLGEVTLDEVLRTRLAQLPAHARRLLEVIAVAGGPIAQGVAREAASLEAHARAPLDDLRGGRLVLTRGVRSTDPVETAHDRIRETVTASLSPARLREAHRLLATALETADGDAETLAAHYEAAGDAASASRHYRRAAATASEALAFDRAAALYRRALELSPEALGLDPNTWGRLGDALANAGRGSEAAAAYTAAAERADPTAAIDYRRRAAEKLLQSGRIDEGADVLRDVLHAVGIATPATPRRAVASLLTCRARLRLRGLRFRARERSQIEPLDLVRIETCWSASVGFGLVDSVRAAAFQARHLLLSLHAGDRANVSRALTLEAGFRALGGPEAAHHAERLVDRAAALAREIGDDAALGLAEGTRALLAYMAGRWEACRDACDRAEPILRDRCTGVTWELSCVRIWRLWALAFLGETTELTRRVPSLLRDAEQRGDLYMVANLCTGLPNLAWLVEDRPAEARRVARDAMERWSVSGFHLQHYYQFLALVHADLYEGRSVGTRIAEIRPLMKRAFLWRVPMLRLYVVMIDARDRLERTERRPGDLRRVEHAARVIGRQRYHGSRSYAALLRAGVAERRGRVEAASDALAEAIRLYAEDGMPLHGQLTLRRRGALVGGDEGRDMIAAADGWLRARGVVSPARFTDTFVPRSPTA